MTDIKDLFSRRFIKYYGSEIDNKNEIIFLPAVNLLTRNRIDLVPKILFINAVSNSRDSLFLRNLYKTTLRIMTNGKLSEPGNNQKNNFDDYVRDFNRLFDSLIYIGFDSSLSVIPVGSNNVILDGSHRIAASILLGYDVPIYKFKNISVEFNKRYFKRNLMGEDDIDFVIQNYYFLKKNILIGCLWPTAYDSLYLFHDLIKQHGLLTNLVDTKEVRLNFNGHLNLILNIYLNQQWLGNPKNNFEGARSKSFLTYKEDNPVVFFAFEDIEKSNITKIKEEFRSKLNLGKHSIHFSDTYNESLSISRIIYNANSLNMLKVIKINNTKNYFELLKKFKENIHINSIDSNNIMLTSSIILALIGVRLANDVDFITLEDHLNVDESHNKFINYFNANRHDLFTDPINYFWFMNTKFVSLINLIEFKKLRNETKDKFDIISINNKFEHKLSISHSKFKYLLKFRNKFYFFFGRMRVNIIEMIMFFLRVLKLDNKFRFIYRKYRMRKCLGTDNDNNQS